MRITLAIILTSVLTACSGPSEHWVDNQVVQSATNYCASYGGLNEVGQMGQPTVDGPAMDGRYHAIMYAVCNDNTEINAEISWSKSEPVETNHTPTTITLPSH